MNKCNLCSDEALLRCSSCKKTWYCSKEHQRSDWKKHKKECCKYIVEMDETVGRHLIASRFLKAGSVVMTDEPLTVWRPAGEAYCLGCLVAITVVKHRCEICGWPLCSFRCGLSPLHQPECQMFCKYRARYSAFSVDDYWMIPLLRAFALRDRDPVKWEQMLNMESHYDSLGKFFSSWRSMLLKFYSFFPIEDFPEEIVRTVWSIQTINSFERPFSSVYRTRVRCLLINGSLFEHSCYPNCIVNTDDQNQFVFYSVVDVQKNEHLSISYVDPFLPTRLRRKFLQYKCFVCQCQRCRDPTELKSHIGTVKCPECLSDYLIPTECQNTISLWKCLGCMKHFPQSDVEWVDRDLDDKFSQLQLSARLLPMSDISSDCVGYLEKKTLGLQRFILDASSRVHPHYFLVVNAFFYLQNLLFRILRFRHLDRNELYSAIFACRSYLEVAHVVEPGLHPYHAEIEYRRVVFERMLFMQLTKTHSRRSLPLSFERRLRREHLQALRSTLELLQYESTYHFDDRGVIHEEIENTLLECLMEDLRSNSIS